MQRYRLLTYPDNPRIGKALVAAAYAGIELDVPADFRFGEDSRSESFVRNAHPLGKVPVLETPDGYIFESNAIVRHIARLADARGVALYGRSTFEASQVDMWMDFAANEIDTPALAWCAPLLGLAPQVTPDMAERVVGQVKKALGALDLRLSDRPFLVGDRVTAADIVVLCSILPLFQLVCDPAFRSAFAHVNRWFDSCISEKEFQVLDPGPLCGADGPGVPPHAQAAAPRARKEGKAKGGGAYEKKLHDVRKEGGRKAQELAAAMSDGGASFQHAVLTQPEGSMELLEAAMRAMNKDADSDGKKGGAGQVAKLLISSSDSKTAVIVHVPEMHTDGSRPRQCEVTAAQWLDEALSELAGDERCEVLTRSRTLAKAVYNSNPDEGRSAQHAKDCISRASFRFLRSRSLAADDGGVPG